MECKFQKGEKVLSLVNGIGVVSDVLDSALPVRVKYPHIKYMVNYKSDGKFDAGDLYPEIFKDGDIHPLLNVPVRIPKQKVKKEVQAFANVYKVDDFSTVQHICKEGTLLVIRDTAEACEFAKSPLSSATIPVTITFEVEE